MGLSMQKLLAVIAGVIFLFGCVQARFQADVAENEFAVKQAHADRQAVYVGEWTASTKLGVRSVKILGDGRAKICLAGDGAGTTDAKIYLDDGRPAMIVKTGAKVRMEEANKEFLLLDIYGGLEKYYAGQVHESCQSAFANFR